MKRFILATAAGLAVLCAASSATFAQVSIEALKGGSLSPKIGSATPAAAPGIGRAAQISVYEGGEYRSQMEARRALDIANAGLRQAGLAVVGARVVAPAPERAGYALHIDYQDGVTPPGTAPRTIETYTSGEILSSAQASSELSASVSNLGSAGYVVLRGQVLARQGRWSYQVDYVRGRQTPVSRTLNFTSGYYLQAYAAVAQRDMMAAIFNLQARGAYIVAYGVFPVWGTPYCVYQIRYLTRY